MLHKLLPSHANKKTTALAEDFMKKLKSDHPQLEYNNGQSAIPLVQGDVYPDPIELPQRDVYERPIVLGGQAE